MKVFVPDTKTLISRVVNSVDDYYGSHPVSKILDMEIRPGEEFMLEGVAGYLAQYKGPLKTVLDIGAHVGELSILAASRGAEHVWAFEPDKENYRALCCNINNNHYESIISARFMAVGVKKVAVNVRSTPQGNTGQRSICFNDKFPVVGTVWATPLGETIQDFTRLFCGGIDFMKMDIEGAEHEVIQSTPPELLRRINYIDLDLHNLNFLDYYSGGCDPEDTLNYIISAGFRLVGRSGDEKAFHVALERV